MDFFDLLKLRYSTKSFKGDVVRREKIEKIFELVSLSPSYKDGLNFKLLLITDVNVKALVEDSIANDNSAKNGFKEAPLAVVVVVDTEVDDYYRENKYYMLDGAIAMYNLLLSASNEGLGSCWIETVEEEHLKNSLDIPERYKVIGITPIGYANDKDIEHKKIDTSLIHEIAYENVWKNDLIL